MDTQKKPSDFVPCRADGDSPSHSAQAELRRRSPLRLPTLRLHYSRIILSIMSHPSYFWDFVVYTCSVLLWILPGKKNVAGQASRACLSLVGSSWPCAVNRSWLQEVCFGGVERTKQPTLCGPAVQPFPRQRTEKGADGRSRVVAVVWCCQLSVRSCSFCFPNNQTRWANPSRMVHRQKIAVWNRGLTSQF